MPLERQAPARPVNTLTTAMFARHVQQALGVPTEFTIMTTAIQEVTLRSLLQGLT